MTIRCAVYTRKSTDEGLDKAFNSLEAQREACEAYIQSQRGQGWRVVKKLYDDGGISGGTMERPALKSLMSDIEAGRVDLVIVYKVDRLTRSLADFAKIIEAFDARGISFLSVTQQFNTANSMGRLTLNVLLSFAQFEREVTAERIRDKIAASKKKGMWMGGPVPLGYDLKDRKLLVNEHEAKMVRKIFGLYIAHQSVRRVKEELNGIGIKTKRRTLRDGRRTGGKPFSRGNLYQLLSNPLYIGRVAHNGEIYLGEHEGIIEQDTWDQVQSTLKVNGPYRNRSQNNASPFLLTGRISDENGQPLYVAQTQNNGKRYGYYVSKGLVGGAEPNAVGWRLPVKAIEHIVVKALVDELHSNSGVLKEYTNGRASIAGLSELKTRAHDLTRSLSEPASAERRKLFRKIVEKVALHPDQLILSIDKDNLGGLLGLGRQSDSAALQIHVPIQMQRRGVEMKLVIEGDKAPNVNPSLCRMIAQAHCWFEDLAHEHVENVREIAARENIRESEITRILRLAFLSPRIVEDILDGKQLENVTTHRLRRLSALPLEWDAQTEAVPNLN